MSKEHPLFPELPEAGQQEAQRLFDKFKKELTKIAENVLGELYCDVAPHIESDSWINFRNDLMSGFRNYGNRLVQGEYDFKEIRQQILRDFREDIIKDLNQDLVKENEELKETIRGLKETEMRRYSL